MRIKRGVKINGIRPEILLGLNVAESIWQRFGCELVVTSGLDGQHMTGSKHYSGLAADLRTRYFSEENKNKVALELIDALGDEFDVKIHSTHIHIEFHPKK